MTYKEERQEKRKHACSRRRVPQNRIMSSVGEGWGGRCTCAEASDEVQQCAAPRTTACVRTCPVPVCVYDGKRHAASGIKERKEINDRHCPHGTTTHRMAQTPQSRNAHQDTFSQTRTGKKRKCGCSHQPKKEPNKAMATEPREASTPIRRFLRALSKRARPLHRAGACATVRLCAMLSPQVMKMPTVASRASWLMATHFETTSPLVRARGIASAEAAPSSVVKPLSTQ